MLKLNRFLYMLSAVFATDIICIICISHLFVLFHFCHNLFRICRLAQCQGKANSVKFVDCMFGLVNKRNA